MNDLQNRILCESSQSGSKCESSVLVSVKSKSSVPGHDCWESRFVAPVASQLAGRIIFGMGERALLLAVETASPEKNLILTLLHIVPVFRGYRES